MPLLNLILSCNVKEAALAKHGRESSTSPPWVVQDWLGQLPALKLHTVSHWDSSLWGAPLRWSWVSPSAVVELGKEEIDSTHRPCRRAIRSLLSLHLSLSCPLRVRSPRTFSQPNPPLLVSSLGALLPWGLLLPLCPFFLSLICWLPLLSSPLPFLPSPPLPSSPLHLLSVYPSSWPSYPSGPNCLLETDDFQHFLIPAALPCSHLIFLHPYHTSFFGRLCSNCPKYYLPSLCSFSYSPISANGIIL